MAEPHIDLGEDGANMSRSLPGEFAHIMSMLKPTCASDVILACCEIRHCFGSTCEQLPDDLARRVWQTLEELTAPHFWYSPDDVSAIDPRVDTDRLEEQCDALMGVIELYDVRPRSPEACAVARAFVADVRRLSCDLCQRMAAFLQRDRSGTESSVSAG